MVPFPAQVLTVRFTVPPEPPPAWFAVPAWPFAEMVPLTVRVPETTILISPPPAPPVPPPVSVPPPDPRSSGFDDEPYVVVEPAPGVLPLPPDAQYAAPPAVAASTAWPVPSEPSKPRLLALTTPPALTVKVVELKLTIAVFVVVFSSCVMVPPDSTITLVTVMSDVLSCVNVAPFWTTRSEPLKGFVVLVCIQLAPDPSVSDDSPPSTTVLFLKVPPE